MPNGTHWHNVIFDTHFHHDKAIKEEARRKIEAIEEQCARQTHEELNRYLQMCHRSFEFQSGCETSEEWVVAVYQKEHRDWAFIAGTASWYYATLTPVVAAKFPTEGEAYSALNAWFAKPNVERTLSVVIPTQLLT